MKAPDLLRTSFTKNYTVSYTAPGGQSVNVTTNTIPVIFSHSSMNIGFPTLTMSATVSPLTSAMTNLTLVFAASNGGSSNVTSFKAVGLLPSGLACGTVNGTGLSCSGGRLSLSYSSLVPSGSQSASVEFNLTSHINYFFSPLTYHGLTVGFNLTGASNALATPTGLTLTKLFTSPALFSGMSTGVTLNAVNSGPFDLYNLTIQTTGDRFDTIASSAVPMKFSKDLAPGSNLTVSYSVSSNKTYGNLNSSVATAKFFFAGAQLTITGLGQGVSVYRPVSVSIQTSPSSPSEGRAFSMGVVLTNPSAVTVSDVHFILPIPGSMKFNSLQNATFSGGNLNVSVSQLGPHSSYSASMTVQASSGVTVLFSSGKLSFVYSGVTLSGSIPAKDVVVGEDALTRYIIPTALVLVALVAAAFYVRRKAAPTAPASQR